MCTQASSSLGRVKEKEKEKKRKGKRKRRRKRKRKRGGGGGGGGGRGKSAVGVVRATIGITAKSEVDLQNISARENERHIHNDEAKKCGEKREAAIIPLYVEYRR